MKTALKHAALLSILLLSLQLVSAEYSAPAQPWDLLRTAIGTAETIDLVTKGIVFALSLAIAGIAFLAYRKHRTRKLLFVTMAFSLFAVKWLFMIADLFVSPGAFFSDPAQNVFELLILAALFIAIFRK